MKFQNILLTFLGAGILFPQIALSESAKDFVLVGTSYDINGNNELPLSYNSQDSGDTWNLVSSFTLPGTQTQGQLYDVTYLNPSKTKALAVGESVDSTTSIFLPVAYTSLDGGSTWNLVPAFSLPSGQTNGYLVGVSCDDHGHCVAVGESFQADFTNNLPLAYRSTNMGVTWRTVPAFTLPAGQEQGLLISVDCHGDVCTTVGLSQQGNFVNQLPLSYVSLNRGKTWSSPATFPDLPNVQGYLNGVSCLAAYCTGVGTSFDGDGNNMMPLAYTSNNSGNTWSLSSSFVLPTEPSSQTQGELNWVTCFGTTCIAVGESFDVNFDNLLPLAYISNDDGHTWTLLPAFTLPEGQEQGMLNKIDCVSETCIASGGSYNEGYTDQLPLSYKTTDGGNTWTLSPPYDLPEGQPQGVLSL